MRESWSNFTRAELRCSCCGRFNPNEEFQVLMENVQMLRTRLGFGIGVSSAYRCTEHPIEAAKIAGGGKAGMHNLAAIDLKCSREQAFLVLKAAYSLGFTGIGIQQKGEQRFIHLDRRPAPTIWSY